MIDPKKIRQDFPMYRNNVTMQKKPLIWLDNASTTFKPDCVIEAVTDYYTKETSNSHRGDYDLCYNMDMKVLESRKAVARFINSDSREVVFTSGTTNSINLVAFGYGVKYLKAGDEILLTQAEHASNVLPWFKVAEMTGAVVKYIPLEEDGRLTAENLEKTITDKTKIVAVAHVTNVLGFIAPVKELAKIAHKHGAIFVLDGAQSVPHIKTDVKDMDVDFLAFSGHKLCGPTGVGVLYGKYELLNMMEPFMTGGGMNAKFDMCGDVGYLEPPLRFEAGTQNLAGILGLKPAIEYLESLGMDNIEAYEMELRRYFCEKMLKLDNVVLYNPDNEHGPIDFNVKDPKSGKMIFAQDAAGYLAAKNVAVRSGNHCAKILHHIIGTDQTVRASLYFYNTEEEVDRAVQVISEVSLENAVGIFF